ncbi:hypothetical protein GPECTOR_47g392 [Gonium pectorale]|uniref:Uncharacterized protein n=1 Tax=Gonium pectorale TaxID=33097 RepID=A0A150G8F4_GONPE|nr:hypothetical protein GPECTOR_47g392 [Gonium pectorale]|eukprot:KXZ46114.1 hypothetical protein GPECTOR_47g392 [Gonium pectorale]
MQPLGEPPKLVPSVLLSGELPPELLPQHVAVYPPDAAGGDGGEDGPARSSLLERLSSHLAAAASPGPLGRPLALLWSAFLSGCRPRPLAPPLAWHPRRPWLAAADAGGRVQLLQLELGVGAVAGAGLGPRAGAGGSAPPGRGRELLLAGRGAGLEVVLAHDSLQPEVVSLAWSPASPGQLAVGSRGAVCVWAVAAAAEGRPPMAAAGRAAGPWMRLLRTRVGGARVTSLSWSPDGRLLAAASPDQAGLQVWEVAGGAASSTVSAGPAAFDTVRWSPCGNYVFAGGPSAAAGSGSAPSSSVVAAAWAPPSPGRGPVLLAALAGLPHLVSLHLVEAPPGLTAQLLPVALPDLQRAAGAEAGPSPGPSSPSIADMSWDPAGERLAVLLAPPRPGQEPPLALYATTTDPLVSARLIGFVRPPRDLCTAAATTASGSSAAAGAGGGSGAGTAAGPSENGSGPGSAPPAPACSYLPLPGALAVARLAPSCPSGPACLVGARVGALGVHLLPCYL